MIEINVNEEKLRELIKEVVQEAIQEALSEKPLPYLMSIPEAAEFLGVSYPTMYRTSKIKGFPVTHDFGHAKVITSELIEWMKNRTLE